MPQKLTLKLPKRILDIAKHSNIDLCVSETNHMTITGHAIPDIHGVCIGKKDVNTGKLISNIKNDDDGAILQKYIKLGLAATKTFVQRTDSNELKDVSHYFMLYTVLESSKYKPTHTEDGPGNSFLINGYYVCQYEVLLGAEDFTRRLVFKTLTNNLSMSEWISTLNDKLEDAFDDQDFETPEFPELKNYIQIQDGIAFITMFDSVGIASHIECESAATFLSMIRSIRQIDCEFIDETTHEDC